MQKLIYKYNKFNQKTKEKILTLCCAVFPFCSEDQKDKLVNIKIEEAEIIRQQMKDKIIRKKKERNDIIKEGEEIKKHFAELEIIKMNIKIY